MARLEGKAALITGGAAGIGKETARLFMEEGAVVTVADRDEAALQKTQHELGNGGSLHTVVGDVARVADAEHMVEAAVAAHGRLDIVVCAAGIVCRRRLVELSEEEFDNVVAVNLKGLFTVTRAAVPRLKEQGGGTIVTIGSEMGLVADPNEPAYDASKGGAIMFTKSIALDLIRDGIRVNCLCPGITQTTMLDAQVMMSPDPDATLAEFAAWAPIGRIADPIEQARGILYLASSESSYAVGTVLLLDGGFTAQ